MRESAPPVDPGPGHRGVARWLIGSAGALGALALLLAVWVVVAMQTEWGTRLLWQMASGLAPGQLSGELVSGTLRDGLHLRNLVYRDATRHITIDRLESGWHLLRSPLTLVVPYLRIGSAEVRLLPAPPSPRTPPKLPRQLSLPLAIELHSASLEHLVIHEDVNVSHYEDIRLQASYDRVQHILTLDHAQTPYGVVTGTLRLQAMAPFDIAGTVGLAGKYQGQYGEESYRLDTRLSGTLQAIGLQLDATGRNLEGHATIDATPFAAVPVRRAMVAISGLDPQTFNPQWPHAKLEMHASLTPRGDTGGELSQLTVTGPVSLRNAQAGAINRDLVPLESVTMVVTLNARTQQLSELNIRLPGKAMLVGKGEIHDTGQGSLALQAQGLDLHAVHTQLKPTQLSGPLNVQFAGDTQQVNLELTGSSLSLTAQATRDSQKIALHAAQLSAGTARLTFRGSLARDAQAAYSASGSLRDFNPARFFASVPQVKNRPARINADIDAHGALHPTLSANIQFNVHDSQYGGLPMTGGGTVHILGRQLLPSDVQLSVAGNVLRLKGSFGKPSDRLALDMDAPALGRLGFGLSGLLQVHGEIGGTPHAPLALDLSARGLQFGDIRLGKLTASIQGTYASHALRVSADGRVRNQALQLTLAAQGGLHDQAQKLAWDGVLRTLENQTSPHLQLQSPLPLVAGPGRLELGAGRLAMDKASIDLQSLVYNNALFRSEGSFRALELGQLLAWRQQLTGKTAPLNTDLVLDGRWNMRLAERADGFVEITRRSGDMRLSERSTLGLGALSLRAKLQGSQIELNAQVDASRLGSIAAQGQVGLQREDRKLTLTARSPVSVHITASVPKLQTIAALAGPRIALAGSASMDLMARGSLGEIKLSGTVAGEHLALTLYDQGVHLRDGVVHLRLENNIVELQQVLFRGGNGTLSATGHMALGGVARGLSATIVASSLQLLASPSAQMTVTGQAVASNANGPLLVSGYFAVDHGLFSLPEKAAPQLDTDVVVVRSGQAQAADRGRPALAEKPAGAFTPRIDIELGLGKDFAFKGAGAELRLAGALTLRSEPGATPQAFGSVRVVEGSYKAFGTQLAIESGVFNFQGPLNNPNVNLLAMRRQKEVAAGVRVTGNVHQPRVQLVSEPDLPQEQQLSWLVFGHSSGGGETGRAKAAVQGAALGLLNKFGTGRAAQTIGLDTLAIGESEFGLAGAQVVNLGKEISDRLYIGYEQSLAGAESVMKLIYELTPSWSVVLRGGTVAGMDVFYSKRFDRLR